MKTRSALAGLALMLAFTWAAQAQIPSGSSGDAARQSVSSGARSLQPSSSLNRHPAAKQGCEELQGNARDICNAEVEGQKNISEAHARLKQHDSQQNQLKLAEARADAEFGVAKARCGDQPEAARQACEDEATALRDLSKARAKRKALTRTSGRHSSGNS